MLRRYWPVVAIALLLAACEDDKTKGANGEADVAPPPLPIDTGVADGGGGGAGGMDGSAGGEDGAAPVDAGVGGQDGAPPPRMDLGVLPDLGPPPDVGPLDGDPCDPRELARACDPGVFCVHVPGERPHIGRCQAGDGCRPGHPEDCPDPARPYCHLKGGGTFCTAPGRREEGEDCVDNLGIPQPCAEGLLCDNSVCRLACDPAGMAAECATNWRCESIEAATGVAAGFCYPPSCSFFNGDGCDPGEKCNYAIRNDGQIVGSCSPEHGQNAEAAPCAFDPGGGDNCAQGLVCIGPPDMQRFCRQLCDTAGYLAPCDAGHICRESLTTNQGPVRGLGLCIVNQ